LTSPNIKTDLTSGVTNLTKQLIEMQKQKLIGQGQDKVNDLLGGFLGGNSNGTKTDSTKTKTDSTKLTSPEDNVKEGVKSILSGLLGGNKKVKDSTEN